MTCVNSYEVNPAFKEKHKIQAVIFMIVLLVSLPALTHANNEQQKQPNVIIFMADDLGQDATALYNPDDSELVEMRRQLGNAFPENAPMPTLEKMAEHGITFKNAWAMPVCSTTRAARSTGRYPSTTGVGQVIGRFTPRFHSVTGEEFPPSILDPDDRQFLQRLAKKSGYLTYKLGKWHEVEVDFQGKEFDPYDLTDEVAAELATQGLEDTRRAGFDHYYGLLSGFFGGINGNGYAGGEVSVDDQPTGAKLDDMKTDAIHLIDSWSTRITGDTRDARNPTTEFADSALVSRAIKLIKHADLAGKPYFMEFSALAPHFQYEVPPGPWDTTPPEDYAGKPGDWRTLEKRAHKEVIVQIIAAFNELDDTTTPTVAEVRDDLEAYKHLYPEVGTRAPAGPSPVAEAQRRAAFKGLVSYMDVQLGRLLKYVDWKNTYVIFIGDNGTQGGGPAFNVIEPPNDSSKSKASIYRNGREVPMVFKGPMSRDFKGTWSNELVSVTDLYATVLDIIGVKQPRKTRKSSYSFAATASGGESKRKFNVSELFPATAAVGGLNPIGSGAPGPFGSGARVVGIDGYSLLAFNRIDENNYFVCKSDSTAMPEEDCLNRETGVYEHVVDLEFYDLESDPYEQDALVADEMSKKQWKKFRSLCNKLNRMSRKATYYQNGAVCMMDGSNLVDIDPQE